MFCKQAASDAFYPMTRSNFFRNIKQIPMYFKHKKFLLKHGYPMSASWSIDYWFMFAMPKMLQELRDRHCGYPASLDFECSTQEEAEAKWDSILTEMIDLCKAMNEHDKRYDDLEFKDIGEKIEKAKDEFFKLYSKWFFNLWD